jgi:hypothetical protein
VASFDPAKGQNPENLVVGRDGTVYVTWLFAHSVVAVRHDGSQAAVSLPPGEATGVAIDPRHPSQLTVALISQDPGTTGICTVPSSAFAGHSTPASAVALPAQAFPNGITYAPDGTLYIADSTRGLILQMAPGASSATRLAGRPAALIAVAARRWPWLTGHPPAQAPPRALTGLTALWGIGLPAAGAAQGIGAITGGLAITNPASFAAKALIALAVEAILAASTIAWLRRDTAPSAQAPAESL